VVFDVTVDQNEAAITRQPGYVYYVAGQHTKIQKHAKYISECSKTVERENQKSAKTLIINKM